MPDLKQGRAKMKILATVAIMLVGSLTMLVAVRLIFMIFMVYDLNIGIVQKPLVSETADPLFLQYILIYFAGMAVIYVYAIYEKTLHFQRNVNEKLYEINSQLERKNKG
jgi:hypothetical protein